MIEQSLRTPYQRYLADPIAARIQGRMSPQQMTLLSFFSGVLVLPVLLFGWVSLAITCLLISGVADTLDGTLARALSQSSPWGSVLDITSDRMVEFTVILALWGVSPDTRSLACLLMLGSVLMCVTSFLVVGIFSQNVGDKSFHYSPGLMERAETFFFFILMMLLPTYFKLLSGIFTLLVCLTAILRLNAFYQFIGK